MARGRSSAKPTTRRTRASAGQKPLTTTRENHGATTVGTAVGTMAVGGNSNFVSPPGLTAITEDWNVDAALSTVTVS